jgi:hypothetical protein
MGSGPRRSVRRPDEEAEEVVHEARRLVASAVEEFVLGRFPGEQLPDFAHFGEAEHRAHVRWVDPVFRRQVDADPDEGRADHSGNCRAPQLPRRRKKCWFTMCLAPR